MPRLHLDYESYATVDIKKVTTPFYTSHPDTRILMLGWGVDDDPVNLWDKHTGGPPEDLISLIKNPNTELHAYNTKFEQGITEFKLGIRTYDQQWHDSAVGAHLLAFPSGLDRVLGAIGLDQKDARGKRLINLFCKPAPKSHKADKYDWVNKPDEWEEFKNYCRQDVEVERQLHHWITQYVRY